MTTLGIVFICLMVAIPILIAFLIDDFMGILPGAGISPLVFMISSIVSSVVSKSEYARIDPKNILIEKAEYQYVLHVKDESGAVTKSIIIGNLKDYELVKSGNFELVREYTINMYGIRQDGSYKLVPAKKVEQ